MDSTAFIARRARLAQLLRDAGGGVAVIATAPERPRNGDSDHPYRHDSSFHYLTGFNEPNAWLLLHASGATTLLCRPRDPAHEIWDGLRLGVDAAPAALGVDQAFDVADLDAVVADQLANQPAVWFAFDTGDAVAGRLGGWLNTLRARARSGVACPASQRDLAPLLAEMRLHKDAGEAATMLV